MNDPEVFVPLSGVRNRALLGAGGVHSGLSSPSQLEVGLQIKLGPLLEPYVIYLIVTYNSSQATHARLR